jgi:hypothetical protein
MLSLCAALSSDTTVMQFKVTAFVARRRFGWPPWGGIMELIGWNDTIDVVKTYEAAPYHYCRCFKGNESQSLSL